MTRDIDTLISRISPISDSEVRTMVSDPGTLAERIMSTTPEVRTRRAHRRRLLIAIPVAAGLAAAAVAITAIAGPGTVGGPRQAQAAALSFSRPEGGYITVRIKDPLADPARYKKEFTAHGMNIDLRFVPVSPSLVGTIVMDGGNGPVPPGGPKIGPDGSKVLTKDDLKPADPRKVILISARTCQAASGGDDCPVGVKIPVGYRNPYMVVFGRAAKPGEQYASSNTATAPGEAMYGLNYKNHTVTDVLAMLRRRNITVAGYRADGPASPNGGIKVQTPKTVPGTWHVLSADPYAFNQVLLFVKP